MSHSRLILSSWAPVIESCCYPDSLSLSPSCLSVLQVAVFPVSSLVFATKRKALFSSISWSPEVIWAINFTWRCCLSGHTLLPSSLHASCIFEACIVQTSSPLLQNLWAVSFKFNAALTLSSAWSYVINLTLLTCFIILFFLSVSIYVVTCFYFLL